jgi:type IV secretion system protein VirB10
MSENTEREEPKGKGDERPPIHKKQAKIYVFAVIGVLVFFLLLDTFQRAGDDKKKEEPQVQTEQMPRESNAPDFESRFTQEVERLQTSKDQPKPGETPKDTMARLEAERNIKEQPYAQPGAEQKVDIYQEFKDQERRRALSARVSRFKLRKKTGMQQSQPAIRTQPAASAMPTSLDSQAIEAEKARVIKEIQKLEKMNQQRGGGSQKKAPLPAMPGYLKPSSGSSGFQQEPLIKLASAQEGAPDALEQITVGMPSSEGEAKEGQKLIPTTTVIKAVLDQQLMSDYTGAYRGLITHDVYDVTQNYIIIPKGSRFIGKCLRISNVNEPIQARMGLTVTWIVLPDGKRISLKKKADMLDQAGIHAVKDKVNYHFLAQFLGVAAYALISSETSRDGSGIAQDDTYEGQVGEAMREQFAPLAAKYLDLVPTITLRAGTPINIFLEDDIFAYEWSSLRKRLFKANRSSYQPH